MKAYNNSAQLKLSQLRFRFILISFTALTDEFSEEAQLAYITSMPYFIVLYMSRPMPAT